MRVANGNEMYVYVAWSFIYFWVKFKARDV